MTDLAGIAQRFNLSPDKMSKLGGIAKYAGELHKRIGSAPPESDKPRHMPVKKKKKIGKPSFGNVGGPTAKEALVGSVDTKGKF